MLASVAAFALVVAVASGAAVAFLGPTETAASVTAQDADLTSPAPAIPTPTPTPTPTPEPDADFTIVAAGDVLPHLPVDADARTNAGYDFSKLLAPMDPWVSGADLAICHLEVPLAPAGSKPSGYPVFAAPAHLAQDLKEQGWDGCSTSSNHSVDRGFAGVTSTLDALDAAGLGHVGTARSAKEAAQPQLYRLERASQTITVAQVAAAYGTNGMPVDPAKPWSVNLIDVPAMVAQAEKARADGADLVIASVHCCVEYRTEPTAEQQAIDQELADSGQFDLVIGHHAHVPQPVAKLEGGPDGTGMWVAYGLGNYLSNQDSACCVANTDSGILLTAHVTSPAASGDQQAGPARVTSVEWTPITVDRLGGHEVHALTDVPDGTSHLSAAKIADRLARVTAAAGDEAPLRSTPATPTGPEPTVVPRTS